MLVLAVLDGQMDGTHPVGCSDVMVGHLYFTETSDIHRITTPCCRERHGGVASVAVWCSHGLPPCHPRHHVNLPGIHRRSIPIPVQRIPHPRRSTHGAKNEESPHDERSTSHRRVGLDESDGRTELLRAASLEDQGTSPVCSTCFHLYPLDRTRCPVPVPQTGDWFSPPEEVFSTHLPGVQVLGRTAVLGDQAWSRAVLPRSGYRLVCTPHPVD